MNRLTSPKLSVIERYCAMWETESVTEFRNVRYLPRYSTEGWIIYLDFR